MDLMGPEDVDTLGEVAPPCVDADDNKGGDVETTTTLSKEPCDHSEHAAPAQPASAPVIAEDKEAAATNEELKSWRHRVSFFSKRLRKNRRTPGQSLRVSATRIVPRQTKEAQHQ